MKTIPFFLLLSLGSIASAGGGSSIGLGNPAAENCVKLEGTLEPTQNDYGQDANCVVDEWHLWSEMKNRGLVKPHEYPTNPVPLPNPAAVNCQDIGGDLRSVETPAGTQGFCVINQWKLLEAINLGSVVPSGE